MKVLKRNFFILILICILLVALVPFVTKISSTHASFSVAGNNILNFTCGSLHNKFIIELYDGNELIETSEDSKKDSIQNNVPLKLDHQYTLKIYNKSELYVDFYMNAEDIITNTFSENVLVEFDVTEEIFDFPDTMYWGEPKYLFGITDDSKKQRILDVKNFPPTDTPIIFTFILDSEKLNQAIDNPEESAKIKDTSFNFSLHFYAEAINMTT